MAGNNDQKLIFSSQSQGSTGKTLTDLISRARLHGEAEAFVMSAVPEELVEGTRFVSCQDGELILSTDTASKATRLRFRQHEIMEAVRANELFRYVWKLKIKVSPSRFDQRRKPKKTRLSKENARLLQEEAGHTKDKALREVLEKLARHVQD